MQTQYRGLHNFLLIYKADLQTSTRAVKVFLDLIKGLTPPWSQAILQISFNRLTQSFWQTWPILTHLWRINLASVVQNSKHLHGSNLRAPGTAVFAKVPSFLLLLIIRVWDLNKILNFGVSHNSKKWLNWWFSPCLLYFKHFSQIFFKSLHFKGIVHPEVTILS